MATLPADPESETGRARAWLTGPAGELPIALGLALLVLATHDVSYLLRQPFWNDEAWVAVTTRFPLSQLPATTSSTPIGWSLLARIFTLGGDQTSRLLPLSFAGAAVAVAYWFARMLDWRGRTAAITAGVLAAAAVLLVPAMLVRNDLKQYTADACLALVILTCTSSLERAWSRRRLARLSVAVWVGMLFSHTALFVGVAAFGAVCVIQLARRDWRRLTESAVAGAATGVLMLAVYESFDARAVVPGLTAYWHDYYLPVGQGLHASGHFLSTRFSAVQDYLGLGPAWLAVPLLIIGLITIARLGRPATALAIAILWPEMLAISALKKYPFLDLRTSTFLFAVTVAVAAIGVAGAFAFLQSRLRGLVGAALVALSAAVFVLHAQPFANTHLIPFEDVRDQARYVEAHAAPDDTILVNLNSNWGFAYYWPIGHPSRQADSAVLQGYIDVFPSQPRIIVAPVRTAVGVRLALADALNRASLHRGTRIWLVRTHLVPSERRAWRSALRQLGLTAAPVGGRGLLVVDVR